MWIRVDSAILELIGEANPDDLCICWRSDERYRAHLGKQVDANELLAMLW